VSRPGPPPGGTPAIDTRTLPYLLPPAVGLAVAWAVWVWPRRRPAFLLPPPRRRAAPWTGGEVLAVLLLVVIVLPVLVSTTLREVGFFTWLYGPGFAAAGPPDGPAPSAEARARVGAWVALFAGPLRVAAILALLVGAGGARLYQLGLTGRRAGKDVAVGVLTWAGLTLFVLAVNVGLTHLWTVLVAEPAPHPLTRLSQDRPLPVEQALIVLAAAVVAPVYEELLFRGVLQPWLAGRPRGGDLAMQAALGLALLFAASRDQPGPPPADAAPVLFVLALTPGYLLVRWRLRSPAANAVYGTSVLFGLAHAGVWPTPVALFVLALGLGTVAYRTQSVIPAVVAHALFNGVACVLLLVPQPGLPTENGRDATAAGRPPAVSASSGVVGPVRPGPG
jgi:membrane protease YdiL (CAAX protease family)